MRRIPLFIAVLVFISMFFARTIFAFADSPLSLTREQIFIIPDFSHDSFQIVEIVSVRNDSSQEQNIHVFLPPGFENLRLEGHHVIAKQVQAGSLIIPRVAKEHSTSEFMLAYSLSLQGEQSMQFDLRTPYEIDVAELYLPISSNSALSAHGLLANTHTSIVDGRRFRVFTRLGIPENEDWLVGLQVLPAKTASLAHFDIPVIGTVESGNGNRLEALGNLILIALVLVLGVLSGRSKI